MDIVEFAERVCNIELLDYQKILLRKFSEIPKDSTIVMSPITGRFYVAPKKKGDTI